MATALTLVRGLPGSGKSTFAWAIGLEAIEADQFFTDDDGVYQFDSSRLAEAHAWCQDRAYLGLEAGQRHGSGLTNVCAGSELRRQLKNEAGSMKPPLKMRT